MRTFRADLDLPAADLPAADFLVVAEASDLTEDMLGKGCTPGSRNSSSSHLNQNTSSTS